jgi:ribosomal-protein-alanine N-acetyltransferase
MATKMLNLKTIFHTFPALETERCMLRAPSVDDAQALFTLMQDTQVLRYLGSRSMTTIDDAVRRVQAYHNDFQQQQAIVWAIQHQGSFIGTCTFWHLQPDHDRAEIGYMLASAFWGKRIATEVCTAVLDFGFSQMGLHSVEGQIDPDNAASRRVLEKLGFIQEGYFHENFFDLQQRRYTDTAVFSLLGATWTARDKR